VGWGGVGWGGPAGRPDCEGRDSSTPPTVLEALLNPCHPLFPTCRQGLTVEGEEFIDSTGDSKQVFQFTAPSLARPPYWDHGFYKLGKSEFTICLPCWAGQGRAGQGRVGCVWLASTLSS